MSTSWTAVENALRAWVVTGSGLASSQVIWLSQGGNKPTGLYVELALGNSTGLGVGPMEETSYDPGAPLGEEVTITTAELTDNVLRIQVYGGDDTGDGSARACASRVRQALNRGSVTDALVAAGVVVYDAGSITNVPAIDGTNFEARSVFEVRFYVNETSSEKTGFIESVEAQGEQDLASMEATFTVGS